MLVNYMEQFSEKGEFSARVNGFSRDSVVDKLWDGNNFHNNSRDKEDNDNGVELSLGLSLNGRFGVDPKKDRIRLIRSASVSASSMVGADNCAARLVPVTPAPHEPLSRTFSVPTDTEAENWRKRKELQSLRRMEARRRRMDKIKILRYERERIDLEDNSSEEVGSNTNSNGASLDLVSSINGNGMAWSQRSMGLESSNSSGFAEFESQSQPVQDRNKLRRSSSVQSVEIQNGQKVRVIPRSTAEKTIDREATKAKEMLKNLMHEMPGVSTIGNGPNGRKIDGFLYRYGKGEEVKIMCVCHGSFLSPAEFVKHAGGTEVDNPLRHIVVNPSPVL